MRKDEIISFIRNLLPKYDKTAKYHTSIITAAIEKVLSATYNDVYARDPLELQRYTKPYGYSVALTILTEASTGIRYTTLPANIIPFPDKASGVRRISTMVRSGLTFFPIDKREIDLVMDRSLVDTVTAKVGYCVTPTRVEYYNLAGGITGVRMDLIVPFSVYADSDQVLIPEINNEKGEDFIDQVLAKLGVIPPVDLKDNNADEIKRMSNGQ